MSCGAGAGSESRIGKSRNLDFGVGASGGTGGVIGEGMEGFKLRNL